MKLSSLFVLALATLCHAQQDYYTVARTDRHDTWVKANRPGVPADVALVQLASVLKGWTRPKYESAELQRQVELETIDLSFDAQPARVVAQLIAVAAGADIVFYDRTVGGVRTTNLYVVYPPKADSENGKERLKRLSVEWYETFLQNGMEYDYALWREKSMGVRMDLAHIMMAQGDLRSAAKEFIEAYKEDESHPYINRALLRIAQCYFELAVSSDNKVERDEFFENCRHYAEILTEQGESTDDVPKAIVVMARSYLQQEQYMNCVQFLKDRRVFRMVGRPEMNDVFLLAATAQMHLGDPMAVLQEVTYLQGPGEVRNLITSLSKDQLADYLFLLGYGLEGSGQFRKAVEPLELFLGTAEADPRKGPAFVMLGRAYLGVRKYVQAHAAAQEARSFNQMSKMWRREKNKLYAKTSLELGKKEEAYRDLGVEVRNTYATEPELALFLVDALIKDNEPLQAMDIAALIEDQKTLIGYTALLRHVEAMYLSDSSLERFPARAIPLVEKLVTPKGETDQKLSDKVAILQSEGVELIGRAYEKNGDFEKAARARQGYLR